MREAGVEFAPPGTKGAAPSNDGTALPRVNGSRTLPAPNVWQARPDTPSWAALLEKFYARAGQPLPRIQPLKENEVPQPYKALLVHSSDMTPTLENFYHRRLGLTVLSREIERETYLREVLLRLTADDLSGPRRGAMAAASSPDAVLRPGEDSKPIEYGVIRICLAQLPPVARRHVLEEQRPLGNILQSEGIPHISWPQAFFRVESDPHTRTVLGLWQPCDLYGRRNVLLDRTRRLLAEVIEILAPVEESRVSG
jgi:hypothetical protein